MATYWENSCSFGLRYVSWYKYLTVSLVFPHLGFWSGNLFLIAPFPDLCLLAPFLCVFLCAILRSVQISTRAIFDFVQFTMYHRLRNLLPAESISKQTLTMSRVRKIFILLSCRGIIHQRKCSVLLDISMFNIHTLKWHKFGFNASF